MKTKLLFLRWIMMLILSANALGAWAQVGGLTQTGDMTVCINSTEPYGVMPTAGSSYTWSIIAGSGGAGTITNSPAPNNLISVLWTNLGTCTLQATELNSSGCTSVIGTILVTVVALPTPTITGPATACLNSTTSTYTTEAGMSNYVWSVSAGGTITAGAGTNAIIVTWNTTGAQTVGVNYDNLNGCTAASAIVYNVTVNSLPVPTITGPAAACVNSTTSNYTTEVGMSNYIWAVSPGGSITAGAGTNAITVTWNTAGAQTVSVNYDNVNGCTAASATVYNVTVNSLPVPTISGPTPVCANSTGNVYTTEAGMSNYAWSVSAGGTITAGAGTNAITVTWNTASAQTVSVNYDNVNGCTAAAPIILNVTVNSLPATSPIWHN